MKFPDDAAPDETPVSALRLPPSALHRAIELGWIRRSPTPEIKIDSYLRRELRAQWHARGLNSRGRPRRNQPRPELTGLPRKIYHREYMRHWRAGKQYSKTKS